MSYNDPNHRHYGPSRRLHLVLMGLFADKDLGRIEGAYEGAFDESWTRTLARYLDRNIGEANAARAIIQNLLNVDDRLTRIDVANRQTATSKVP